MYAAGRERQTALQESGFSQLPIPITLCEEGERPERAFYLIDGVHDSVALKCAFELTGYKPVTVYIGKY
jgi:hypothetical protein